jgi:hypothetical protein
LENAPSRGHQTRHLPQYPISPLASAVPAQVYSRNSRTCKSSPVFEIASFCNHISIYVHQGVVDKAYLTYPWTKGILALAFQKLET